MLMPRKVKYRKCFRGRNRGEATRGNELAFGSYGLQALENEYITARQIEAGRRTISRATKRAGKMWIRIFPHKPVTKKPAEVRMGGGKGAVDGWVAKVKRGVIMFELDGVGDDVAREALRLAGAKMPIKTRIVSLD